MNREEAMDLHPAGKQPQIRWSSITVTDVDTGGDLRKVVDVNGLLWWFGPGGDEW